ncbi:MAG: sulfite exporter TauE/SafE family protein [Candidatus Omnitrophota bacterium]
MSIPLYVLLGLVAGTFSGFLGIGGGTIIIPFLVFSAGFTQHQAQGTTLALMVPPIGLLAAMRYYADGNVNIKAAAFICIGFILGGLIGAHFVSPISDGMLKKIFGIYLVLIGIRMVF